MVSDNISEAVSKIKNLPGIDLVYFLSRDLQIVQEHKNTNSNNYLEQILVVLKSQSFLNELGTAFPQKSFHTYTLLNETGLIVILKLGGTENLYMVVIAGENQPVDLINLLKICKETRLNFRETLEV